MSASVLNPTKRADMSADMSADTFGCKHADLADMSGNTLCWLPCFALLITLNVIRLLHIKCVLSYLSHSPRYVDPCKASFMKRTFAYGCDTIWQGQRFDALAKEKCILADGFQAGW